MASENLTVLIEMPPGIYALFDEALRQRFSHAHPQVSVEIIQDHDQFLSQIARADGAMVAPRFRPPAAVLQPGTRLRWVHSLPAGVDHVLTPEVIAAEHITITSTKGPMGPLIAEHALLLMLALARDLPGFLQHQAERRWGRHQEGRQLAHLYGKTIAILGVGVVGGHLARICQVGFGMQVLGLARTRHDNPHVDRYIDRADLHTALAEADVVALCLALTPATRHIIDAAALAAMKPSAILINIARGGLVDEAALIAALQAGQLAGAGLDATAVEPLPPDSPLWTMPNVIITPHVAPAGDRLRDQFADFWCENICRFAEGQPLLGLVDRHAGY